MKKLIKKRNKFKTTEEGWVGCTPIPNLNPSFRRGSVKQKINKLKQKRHVFEFGDFGSNTLCM